MSILLSIALALVLSIDAYVIAAGCSAMKKIAYSHGFFLAVCFSILHAGFLVGGYYIGKALGTGVAAYDVLIAVAMFVFVGIKIILKVLRKIKDVNTTYVTDAKSIIMLSLATSFDFLFFGMGLGFPQLENMLWCAAFLMFFTIVSTFFGVLMGRQQQRKGRRWATFVVGILIIAFAVRFLLKSNIL